MWATCHDHHDGALFSCELERKKVSPGSRGAQLLMTRPHFQSPTGGTWPEMDSVRREVSHKPKSLSQQLHPLALSQHMLPTVRNIKC
jgi:hypothetical protein